MRPIAAVIAVVFLAGCASVPAERACSTFDGVRFVDFVQSGFGGNSPRRLPQLQRDFFRRVVESSGRMNEVRRVLTAEVNDFINTRLDALNRGRYDTIEVTIDRQRRISVMPDLSADPRPGAIMVWFSDANRLMLFDSSGSLLRAGVETAPPVSVRVLPLWQGCRATIPARDML